MVIIKFYLIFDSFGGVILLNKEKSITCKNTLDIRIDLSY